MEKLQKEIERLKKRIAELEHIHQLDMAEIVYLRRQNEFLIEGKEAGK